MFFARMSRELEEARSQLESRKLVDRAKGILMKTRGLSEADAYALLRKTAMNENRKIAEIRNFYEAKIAEIEVLHQGRLRTTYDPAERVAREEEYRRDRERLSTERDGKIEKVRRGEATD